MSSDHESSQHLDMTSQNLSDGAKSFLQNKVTGRMSALQESAVLQDSKESLREHADDLTPSQATNAISKNSASPKKKTVKKTTAKLQKSLAISRKSSEKKVSKKVIKTKKVAPAPAKSNVTRECKLGVSTSTEKSKVKKLSTKQKNIKSLKKTQITASPSVKPYSAQGSPPKSTEKIRKINLANTPVKTGGKGKLLKSVTPVKTGSAAMDVKNSRKEP